MIHLKFSSKAPKIVEPALTETELLCFIFWFRCVTWVLSGLTECLRKRRQTFSTYLSFRISCLAFNVQSPLPRLAFNSVQDFWLLSADSLSLSHTTTCHFSPTMNGYALPINQLFLLLFNFHKIILFYFNWNWIALLHILI